MKKRILLFMLAFVLIIPIMCFAGCLNDNDAKEDGLYIKTQFKTEYIIGESLNVTGGILNNIKDGKDHYVTVKADMITGFDSSIIGSRQMIVTFNEEQLLVDYSVTYPYKNNTKYFSYNDMYYKTFIVFENNTLKMYQINNKLIYANATNFDQTCTLMNTYDVSYQNDNNGSFAYFSIELNSTVYAKFTVSNGELSMQQLDKATSQPVSTGIVVFKIFDSALFNSKICDNDYYCYYGAYDNNNTNVYIITKTDGSFELLITNLHTIPATEICKEQLYINKFDIQDGKMVYYSNDFDANIVKNTAGGFQASSAASTYYLTLTQADEDGYTLLLNIYDDNNYSIFEKELEVK